MLTARVLVAAIVAASFLITVAPLGTASSAGAGMMDCCVGKPGGSCASGLLGSARIRSPNRLSLTTTILDRQQHFRLRSLLMRARGNIVVFIPQLPGRRRPV